MNLKETFQEASPLKKVGIGAATVVGGGIILPHVVALAAAGAVVGGVGIAANGAYRMVKPKDNQPQ